MIEYNHQNVKPKISMRSTQIDDYYIKTKPILQKYKITEEQMNKIEEQYNYELRYINKKYEYVLFCMLLYIQCMMNTDIQISAVKFMQNCGIFNISEQEFNQDLFRVMDKLNFNL